MRYVTTILSFFLLTFLLSGCGVHIYRPDVQQGNVIKQENVAKLHAGMTQEQVEKIMGAPVLKDTFDNNQMTYVYTFKPGSDKMTMKSLTLTFKQGRLTKIDKSL